MVTSYIYSHCPECGNTEYDIHKSIWSLRFTSITAKQCLHCILQWQRARSWIWWCGWWGFCGSLLLTKKVWSVSHQASFSTSSVPTSSLTNQSNGIWNFCATPYSWMKFTTHAVLDVDVHSCPLSFSLSLIGCI